MRVQGAGSVLSNPREQELAIFQYASRDHLGPRLYAVFDNGYLAEYVTGRVVKVDELREPEMMKRIASVVASWHSLDIPSSVVAKRLIPWRGRKPLKTMSLSASTWQLISRWLVRAKRLYAAEDAVALAKGAPHTFDAYLRELAIVQQDLLPFYALSHAIVLCHNDFNHGNLLFNDSKKVLFAVDLEFAGINHRGFDLGNHFCEWAGLDLLYHKCPSNDQMLEWILLYLDALGPNRAKYCQCEDCISRDHSGVEHLTSDPSISFPPTSSSSSSTCSSFSASTSAIQQHESKRSSKRKSNSHTTSCSGSTSIQPLQQWEVHVSKREMAQEMVVEARKWMQASHLFWWLWAMIQIKISNVEGFDAKNYAQVRWAEYMKHKEATLALKHPQRLTEHSPPFAFPPMSPTSTPSSSSLSSSSSSERVHGHHRRRSSSKR